MCVVLQSKGPPGESGPAAGRGGVGSRPRTCRGSLEPYRDEGDPPAVAVARLGSGWVRAHQQPNPSVRLLQTVLTRWDTSWVCTGEALRVSVLHALFSVRAPGCGDEGQRQCALALR